ncbi:MAG: vitamin B12-dependent ribonucleotide reductase [bacterium]|nr:vitamin B12-dependent ribonucleotide reductase [bacterium]
MTTELNTKPRDAAAGHTLPFTREDAPRRRGLAVRRHYSTPGVEPFDTVEWQLRDAVITDETGAAVFEQRGVEVPEPWSQTATNVVVSKYFRGALGTPERESSVRQLIGRVVETVTAWGRDGAYFAEEEDAEAFRAELQHILLHQMACFNSPVWFNVGIEPEPQCSACFINSVEDTMPSILELAKTEGMLFKYGSGSGSNLSTIRSSKEGLSGGGTASGPVSFMKGLDAFAGVIKSGGKTRRAAKMVILDVDHPDIEDFILCKELEERKAGVLIDAGYSGGFDDRGGAYESLFYQNANHSVRTTDEFMRAVEDDADWTTRAVTDGRPVDSYKARDLLRKIADATWTCGDPGMQYDTTINAWHTCPASGRIRASNPCSEFMFLDDSACNLASLNLARFHDPESGFDVDGFEHVCEVMITAQEILIDNAGYPTRAIAENSKRFRPLGLGYSNLGALLMACGLPYDSGAGRDLATAITALMSGTAYAQSARCAAAKGPFEGFEINREPMLEVLGKHRGALDRIEASHVPAEIIRAAEDAWEEVLDRGARAGLRNSQISVLAPTGTIAFMMDCDTTGVEPDIALVKYKKLVGGGSMKIVNRTVPLALDRLGYDPEARRRILDHIDEHDTIEGAPDLKEEHLPVFDCALKPLGGERSIHYMGHLQMLAAVQPFISGAISKTINMPEETTTEEIGEAYREAWRLGLKAVAIYRDGCKRSQPLSARKTAPEGPSIDSEEEWLPARRRLPDERRAITHKFSINQHEGYITVGLYDDGQPGEIFLVMAKEGSTISGLMDVFATAVSIALQYGVPLKAMIDKFTHTRFEPSGFTQNPQIPMAKSVADYIFRWLASKFLDAEDQHAAGLIAREASGSEPLHSPPKPSPAAPATFLYQQDAPPCHVCGSIMVRAGSCYECFNCGATSGCS